MRRPLVGRIAAAAGGVDRVQPRVQRLRPAGGQLAEQATADRRGLAGELQPVECAAQVQPRAADQR